MNVVSKNPSIEKKSVSDLVINYHVTEACNFGCNYCYARWQKQDSKELHGYLNKVDAMFSSLKTFFAPGNENNPLSRYLNWKNIRLNFAGGEPFLIGRRFEELIEIASYYDFKVSMITNGSLLTDEFIKASSSKISMIGFSIDSVNDYTLRKIGRCNKRDETLDMTKLFRQIQLLRRLNGDIKIKVNTVVNSINQDETFDSMLHAIKPDKWKVLQVLPVLNNELDITEEKFNQFLLRHEKFKEIIVPENNTAMTDSYLMINPKGCFYQNSHCTNSSDNNYIYSPSILDVGAGAAFNKINFNAERFSGRY